MDGSINSNTYLRDQRSEWTENINIPTTTLPTLPSEPLI